jgi:hypothetical protein
VRQEHSRGDGRVGGVRVPEDKAEALREVGIEIEKTLLDEPQDPDAGHGLGYRGDAEPGVSVHGEDAGQARLVEGAMSEVSLVHDLIAAHGHDRQAGKLGVRLCQDRGEPSIELAAGLQRER